MYMNIACFNHTLICFAFILTLAFFIINILQLTPTTNTTTTNPFVTTSQRQQQRQQILVPKELFPISNHLNQQNGNVVASSCATDSAGATFGRNNSSNSRPVKLPLRKHHSFHFQPSQTVSGTKQQLQLQQQHQHQSSTSSASTHHHHSKKSYKNNGPLVFKPFSEETAFKPITPVPKSPQKSASSQHRSLSSASSRSSHHHNHSSQTINHHSVPRICGTSLKRHEAPSNRRRHTDDENDFLTDDEDSTPSSSSVSTARGGSGGGGNDAKRLHYADLAPLSVHSMSNSNNSSSSTTSSAACASAPSATPLSDADDRISLKHLTKHRQLSKTANAPNTTSLTAAIPNNNNNNNHNNNSNRKRTTQYATIKFNEVNI